jgi:RHS repeat-associated protein
MPASVETESYSYDGADVILDVHGDGTSVEYVNGLGVDEKLSLRVNGGAALYFAQDRLGSTRALTDASGNVVEVQQYDSFGDGAGSVLTRYGFTGRERDADTGLMYYRARWYDPQQGRFLSEDPIGLEGGVNLYAYVGNDPANSSDPLGLWPSIFRWKIHQNITRRALGGRASAKDIKILTQEQEDFDNATQAEVYANYHAMRKRGQSREDARRNANRFVRTEICLARSLARNGHRSEAMHHLSRAMHTVQDATSPAHANFNEAWEDSTVQILNHIPHYLTEKFDPGHGSMADKSTLKVWKYFTGELLMPDDFFGNGYDLKNGLAYFSAEPTPDGGNCGCQ